MAADPSRIELRLSADPRFLPGIAGAVAHFADRAGLDLAGQAELGAAAEAAFHRMATMLDAPGGMFGIIVEDFADRVEVTFEYEGQVWPAGGEKIFSGVDRVRQDAHGRFSRLILTQFIAAHRG